MTCLTKLLPSMLLCLATAALAAPEALQVEAEAKTEALVKQGYNFTKGFVIDPPSEKTVDRFELLVPVGEPHLFSLWAASSQGPISARLLGPDGTVRASFEGMRGEVTVGFEATVGKYTLELEHGPGVAGRALLGVKGPALHRCEVAGVVQERLASAAKGFHWPYLLLVPSKVTSKHLLVRPNNSGFSTEELELLRAAASCELAQASALAEKLESPLLVPLFPRPSQSGEQENLYLHALTRDALKTTVPALKRVDLQLIAMIDDARVVLKAKGLQLEPTVLLWGFSASGSFVDRFSVLHPERVLAAAVGSPGGWPLAPVRTAGPDTLPYPVGVADLERLVGKPADLAGLKKVSRFFFLGDQDENDAVVHRDSFSKEDEALIARRFGTRPVARWSAAEKLSRGAGLESRFKLYPGAAHSVTPQMSADIEAFFAKALGKTP